MKFCLLDDTLSSITGKGDLGAVLRAAGTTFVIRVVATVISYISILALARWMGAAEYGAFSYAMAWAHMLVMPTILGIPSASVRFLPEYVARGAWPSVRGLLGWGTLLIVLMSVAVALTAIAIVVFSGDRVPDAYRRPLIIALAGLPVVAMLTHESQVGRAFGWVGIAYLPSQIWHPLLVLAAAGLLAATNVPVVAELMLLVLIGAGAACVLVQGCILLRRLRPSLRDVVPQHDRQGWLRVSLPLLLIDGFAALISYADILMIGLFVGPVAVAYYVVAVRTAALVSIFYGSINALSGPRIAELYAQGQKNELQRLMSGIAPWITVPPAVVTLVLAAMGSILLGLFGAGFEVAHAPLILLALANLVTSVTGPAALLLNMTGHQDLSVKVFGTAAVANVALNALLIPKFGLTGAAFATMIVTSVSNVALAVVAQRRLGIRTSMFASR